VTDERPKSTQDTVSGAHAKKTETSARDRLSRMHRPDEYAEDGQNPYEALPSAAQQGESAQKAGAYHPAGGFLSELNGDNLIKAVVMAEILTRPQDRKQRMAGVKLRHR
jgi:hypothetical protein